MRTITPRFREALGKTHKRTTELMCTVPGGTPVQIGQAERVNGRAKGPGWTAGSVSCAGGSGVRYSANFTITPEPGRDTYGMVSTPGAIFTVRHGIDFGAGDVELIACGKFEAKSGNVPISGGQINLGLVDQWSRLDRCRFLDPYSPGSGTRASKIVEAVTAAIPTVSTQTIADGGNYVAGNNLWDRDRTTFITDMARDGSLDAHLDAAGVFLIKPEPILDPDATVWTYRTGEAANLTAADRDMPFDRRYNMVVVEPIDESQSWVKQVIRLEDTNHPLHPNKYGEVPIFYSSPTILTEEDAKAAGRTILQRVLGITEKLNLAGLSNPALEYGDVIAVVHAATETDPGLMASHFIESWQMDLVGGGMTLATRSSTLSELEDS